jgi:hypothetical protein
MVTNVRWVLDQHGRPAPELDLDGHPTRIRSSQETVLLQRGTYRLSSKPFYEEQPSC